MKNVRDRYTVENGIIVLRPFNRHTGKIMGTEAERTAAIAECQKVIDGLWTDPIEEYTHDTLAHSDPSWY